MEDICWIYQQRDLADNLRRYGWRETRRVMRQGTLSQEWMSHRGRPPVRPSFREARYTPLLCILSGEGRGLATSAFLLPLFTKCVERKFSEIHIQPPAYPYPYPGGD